MKFNYTYGILVLFIFLLASCRSGKPMMDAEGNTLFRVGFYNVENLFDLVNDPNKNDDYFTPEGDTKWDKTRYEKKLNDLGKVVKEMGFPTLLGVCEVENKLVCRDFCHSSFLKSEKYGVVHHESPDFRGIDVALLYKRKQFKVLSDEVIRINFPKEVIPEQDYTTRDVLVVKGIFNKRDTFYVFVNHWPSRRGGLKASQPKRVYVAKQVRKKVDEIYAVEPNANILIMGDFNDEPDNKSLEETLGATMDRSMVKTNGLYNLMSNLDQAGKGSYNYRGNWNMLDQLIVSSAIANGKNGINFLEPVVFQKEWMIYHDKKFGDKPNRTYGGPNYYGGFSDHFPIYVDLIIEKN